ncbi:MULTISPECIES: hypothetical protein [unclassified Sphingobacterium]|uniref:hypothetical protein n=1 Tax=unclassified Sphingobacterium TaxID=2609468 RepID=UPI00295297DD|nr:hypothetical protein [Sphingobacterium sp. UGAL515B_05]WON96184.1 hypothetical protein OK025_07155 [Sphingobacterium sp. UGAL515B_05]
MNFTTSSELSQTRYRIAELILEFNHPSDFTLAQLLPSFRDFQWLDATEKTDIRIDIRSEQAPISNDMGALRTDESIAWGDRFRFYEKEDTFITTIRNEEGNAVWYLQSDRNFEHSILYVPASTADEQSGVITWMAMMIFGQASLLHNTIMIHASVVNHEGKGVAFLGKSGTGKSTHSRLWLKHIPNTVLLNDDNPAVRITNEGVLIYGTPWSGKTPCYKNEQLPLQGFVRLQQAPMNEFEWQTGLKGFIAVLPSCTSIRWNKELFANMNTILEKIIAQIPVGYLKCLPDAAAAELCHSALFPDE